jgi:hypothetical protein
MEGLLFQSEEQLQIDFSSIQKKEPQKTKNSSKQMDYLNEKKEKLGKDMLWFLEEVEKY